MPIDFVGFTGDTRISGQIPLADDRLTDMLNSVARIVVRGASIEEIDHGRIEGGDVMVPCGEFLAVAGTGRRGLESLRRHTVTREVRIGLGRYVVTGKLHVEPGVHEASQGGRPDELLAGRDLLVPLTDANIDYDRAGKPCAEAWETLLVNRARASWIEAVEPEEEELEEEDEVAARSFAPAGARYAKDFTEAIAE